MQNRIEKAKNIKLLILDVDGVLTDGKLFFDEQGREYKSFNARDGLGIKLLQKAGIQVAVISGRASKPVVLRMEMLGIDLVYLGQTDKGQAFKEIIAKVGCTPDQAAHVGDDLIDLPVLLQVGLAIAVQDASEYILPYIDWQTRLPGGQGAVREVCDFILQAQGKMDGLVNSFKKL
ncbi:MAG: HAD-IIIA family hydrolase [Gammaproteobacteria bacterium]|jgi:3-deoxy-D-manno-octulosonate 8-phosphate phosphatase (KDO 8-P phosphatase)|nr:HAD-IIIA family hydrolase [Gammaproteobacteria bacterium]MBT5221878.1 HAD-IIIA family hydrolase [Gammaproteobacteria bacterium]MBT5824904.1 HAD-IIIA family hydrolase [Gammaproteobacteria bacterium]MBT5967312.1 HAD-IIIA family hydrolase [Gammaproteobacteria bacterium]MBT6419079.1 HAD-IIIA family hydrolase [Gammaproteobacteria bacterium]